MLETIQIGRLRLLLSYRYWFVIESVSNWTYCLQLCYLFRIVVLRQDSCWSFQPPPHVGASVGRWNDIFENVSVCFRGHLNLDGRHNNIFRRCKSPSTGWTTFRCIRAKLMQYSSMFLLDSNGTLHGALLVKVWSWSLLLPYPPDAD